MSSRLWTALDFCMQDCHCQIAQVEYQGQTQRAKLLDCRHFIWYLIVHRLESKLKFFYLAKFLLNAHQAAHQPQKSYIWELAIEDRPLRSSYVWLVSNTVGDYFQGKLLKKSNQKSKTQCSSLHGFQMLHFHATDSRSCLAANFGFNWFRTMPDIVSQLLHTAIWSCCAVQFKSDQTAFSHVSICCFCTELCLEHKYLFLCPMFIQRPTNDWKIELSDESCSGR